jgi:NhaP-type Na+/H+ or K+/H+ antiporter
MVFFALFLDLVKGNATSLVGVVGNFVRTSIGGPLFGILFGMAISFWIKRIIRDNVLLVTVTVVGAYLCFYLG